MRLQPTPARRFESSEMFRCGITLGAANCPKFFRRDVGLQTPPSPVRTLSRQDGIKRDVGRSEGSSQSRQFWFRRDFVQLKQVAKTACDRSDAPAQSVVHNLGRLNVRGPHPESLRHFRDTTAILRLPSPSITVRSKSLMSTDSCFVTQCLVVPKKCFGLMRTKRNSVPFSVRFTEIYVYRDGRWQCVAGHESHFPQRTLARYALG